jgi:hypothetical protein
MIRIGPQMAVLRNGMIAAFDRRSVGHHEAREALVFSVAVTVIMLIEGLILLILC